MTTTTELGADPENYTFVIVGVAGSVHGCGLNIQEGTAYRAEASLDAALLKLRSDGVVIDLSAPERRDWFLGVIPRVSLVDLTISAPTLRSGKRCVPWQDYLAEWRALGARITPLAEALATV